MANNRVHGPMAYLVVAVTLAGSVVVPGTALRAQHVALTTREVPRETQRVTVNVDGAPLDAVLRAIAQQAGLTPVFDDALVTPATRVTLHVREISAEEAFEQALHGTGLQALVRAKGQVVIVRGTKRAVQTGTIEGRVTVAASKQAVRRAKVQLDASDRVVETNDEGRYRIPNVSAGAHTVTVRTLGYAKAVRNVEVPDDATITVNIALEPAASPLNQVVVTGTVVATALKAVPNATTVITAKQIEERGITRIEQLFRGDVPGVFAQSQSSRSGLDEVVMYSRGTTALVAGDAAFLGTNPIKTYVDGVELSNPKYLSQIDPTSIERIEILTGPQASTIYGSNAMNGVMQIFTKRGSSAKPQITLNLMSGWVENDFSTSRTPQHDYSGQLTGLEGRISYSAGGSWVYLGPWTPARQTMRTSAFGAARLSFPTPAGLVTADVSARWGNTINRLRGQADQAATAASETGYWVTSNGRDGPESNKLAGQTFGVTMGYTPTSWWSHQFVLGQDISNTVTNHTAPTFNSTQDTLLGIWQTDNTKRSLQYVTTIRAPLSKLASATVTLGADSWQTFITTIVSSSPRLIDGLNAPYVGRQPLHNAGAFIQSQVGVDDHLFLTYGLRAEWNPAYGQEALPNYAPRYGFAYTTDIGPITAKLRGAYGRATRPPVSHQKNPRGLLPWDGELKRVYGDFNVRLANPDLGPEHQQGVEGGVELYFGNRASLVVTRYNQTVDALIIDVPGVDSTKSLLPNPRWFGLTCADVMQYGFNFCSSQDPDGYTYFQQTQNINASGIRNQGWEMQGNVVLGPLSTRAMYSWTKSRSMGVTTKYASRAVSLLRFSPQYRRGAALQFIPEHTWALGMTYARGQTTVALNVNGVGSFTIIDDELYLRRLDPAIRLDADLWNIGKKSDNFQGSFYNNYNQGYMLADLTASHRLTPHIETVLEVQNLGNRYQHDVSAREATVGRQTRLGFRIRS
jgi:outer membrane receptor protein involved in Fe transport